MAQRLKSDQRKKTKVVSESLPFTKVNYWILLSGIALIVLGYIALGQDPWDGFMALVVAPVLLVLGYCVVIPIGILFRSKQEREHNGAPSQKEIVVH
jgi:uncharacterized membrane protein HdeD (DUF308 family)